MSFVQIVGKCILFTSIKREEILFLFSFIGKYYKAENQKIDVLYQTIKSIETKKMLKMTKQL